MITKILLCCSSLLLAYPLFLLLIAVRVEMCSLHLAILKRRRERLMRKRL